MNATHQAVFMVPGQPRGKERPRFNRSTGHAVTPMKTRALEARVRECWMLAGSPDLGDGPISVSLDVVAARPGGHFRVNGELNAAGLRAHRPVRSPDLDNVAKAICDALNQCAFKDDRQIVDLDVHRRWCEPGEREHTTVRLARISATHVAPTAPAATAAATAAGSAAA